MASTKLAVLALLTFLAPGGDAKAVQVSGGGNLVRKESDPDSGVRMKDSIVPAQPHVLLEEDAQQKLAFEAEQKLEQHRAAIRKFKQWHREAKKRDKARKKAGVHRANWPDWSKYLENSVQNATFVQIGSKGQIEGDPIYDFASKYSWKGFTIDPVNANVMTLQGLYANHKEITALEINVGGKDETVTPKGVTEPVKSVSLDTVWKDHVFNKFGEVDILALDSAHAVKLLLKSQLLHPKPKWIVYNYKGIPRKTRRALDINIIEQWYSYVARNAEYELHKLGPEMLFEDQK